MNIFKSLFKKKDIKFLGRGGIIFNEKNNDEFFIATNNYMEDNGKIEIYYEDIKLIKSETGLTITEKKKIALKVKKILESKGKYTEIKPALSIDFLIENE